MGNAPFKCCVAKGDDTDSTDADYRVIPNAASLSERAAAAAASECVPPLDSTPALPSSFHLPRQDSSSFPTLPPPKSLFPRRSIDANNIAEDSSNSPSGSPILSITSNNDQTKKQSPAKPKTSEPIVFFSEPSSRRFVVRSEHLVEEEDISLQTATFTRDGDLLEILRNSDVTLSSPTFLSHIHSLAQSPHIALFEDRDDLTEDTASEHE